MKTNLNKNIWEGWTVGNFIDELSPILEIIQSGNSWKKAMTTKKELKEWCMDNQPHYKKYIPEVVDFFTKKYNLKL